MPVAVIAFDFDPLLRLGDAIVVRWQTVALAAVIALTLIVAGLIARRSQLRPDDVLMLAVGAVPGAVVLGRLGYVIAHPDAFGGGPGALLDPAVGGLDLAAAVVGGALTAAYVLGLLGAPIGRWAHLAALPLLVVLGAGKLTMILGGSGQGLPWTGTWATAFLGPGPWGSLAPALPSHPAQAYEGVASLAIAVVLVVAAALGVFRGRDGRLFLVAIGAWTLARAAVTATWRDPVTLGALPAAGWLAVGIALGCLVLLVVVTIRRRQRGTATEGATAATDEPIWPDPATRPRF